MAASCSCGEVRRLAAEVVRSAREAHASLGCAESCTGGLVSGAITAVPGSSEVLLGGIVSYAIPVKHAVLGVEDAVLDDPRLGAVSGECACQMSEGAARVLGADVCVSVTGIAGPGGAEPGKPVGTVWFGLCVSGRSRAELRHLEGSRDEVREQAVACALTLLCEGIAEIARSRAGSH